MNYDLIFDNIADAVCVLGKKGHIKYLNRVAVKLLLSSDFDADYKDDYLWSCFPMSPVNDDFIQLFIDVVTTRSVRKNVLLDFEDRDGEVHKLHVCMTHFVDTDASENTFIIFTDVTELLRVTDAFARYTSKSIAQQVLYEKNGDAIGGSLKDATILMSDIRGFTALSKRLPPSALVIMINHYFEEMAKLADKYSGTIIEFLGDGIFIVFNAPGDVPDHPAKAVACAIEMQGAMEGVNRWNAEQGYPAIHMGVGINSGDVIVGNIGSKQTTKYNCIGDNANLAGRVESFSVGGQVLVSASTVERIREELEVGGTMSILPKGAGEEMTIYDVRGIGEPYNVHLKQSAYDFEPLTRRVEVEFYRLAEKSVDKSRVFTAKITALGESFALMETTALLNVSDNLQLDIGEALYAKVMECREDGTVICFTSKPPSFEAWFGGL